MSEDLESLIKILRDRELEHGDRLDAASYMEQYDDDRAEMILCEICVDTTEDEDVLESSSESLGGIWSRKGRVNEPVYSQLTGRSKLLVDAVIQERNSELAVILKKSS